MTSSHDDFARRLVDAADEDGRLGALPPDLARHEAACVECRDLVESLRLLAQDGDAAFAAVPDGYWDGFEDRLRGRIARRPAARPRWLLAAAAVVLATGAAAWLAVRTGPDDRGAGEVAAVVADPVTVLSTAGSSDVEVALATLATSQDEDWLLEDDETALDGGEDASVTATSGEASIAIEATGFGAEVPGDVLGLLEGDIASGMDEGSQRELALRIEEALRS